MSNTGSNRTRQSTAEEIRNAVVNVPQRISITDSDIEEGRQHVANALAELTRLGFMNEETVAPAVPQAQ